MAKRRTTAPPAPRKRPTQARAQRTYQAIVQAGAHSTATRDPNGDERGADGGVHADEAK